MSLSLELRALFRLAFPIIIAQLAQSLMGIVDLYLIAPLGSESMGGIGLGGNFFIGVVFTVGGVLLALDTLVSQAVGRKDHADAAKSFAQAMHIGLVLWPLATIMSIGLSANLARFGVDPNVAPLAASYTHQSMWGVPAVLFSFAGAKFLQAHHRSLPSMFIAIIGNVVNGFSGYAFIFGKWGAPAMGVAGAGIAASISRWLMALLYLAFIIQGRYPFRREHWRPDMVRLKEMFRIGLPAALQLALEIGVFIIAGVLVGRFHPSSLAAHYILLHMVTFTFMVPLGISAAASVRVGHAIGEGKPNEAAFRGKLAIAASAIFMSGSSLALVFFGRELALLFGAQEGAVLAFLTIISAAAAFQVFDGIQVTATGALRGLGDTRSAFLANLFGHWFIAFPLALFLAFHQQMEARGVWLGLAAGLIVVASLLLVVWHRRTREILGSQRESGTLS